MRELSYVQRVVLGLTAVALAASSSALAIKAASGAYADEYTLTAVFPRGGQSLDKSSSVKIRGVTVGHVARISLRRDGRANVVLRIHADTRVPDTTSASGEPLSVFGPKYIRLDPGAHESTGPYLAHGATITNTTPATEVTDVVSRASHLLDAVDPGDLFTVVHTLAGAVDGLGPQLAHTVDSATNVAGVLDAHASDVRTFLADLAGLAGDLADKGDELAATARDARPALDAVAAQPDQLGSLLTETSDVTQRLAALVNGHGRALDDLINGLSPAVAAIYAQLASVPNFLKANSLLIGGLGERLLVYTLPDGHIAGVIRGPASTDPCWLFFGFPGCPPVVRENGK
jgi:phospholipid/cholesterol/gamma-HCH transport system substrate-binding protein